MQKRLIEELAECRGGPNRLKKMRREFAEKYEEMDEELAEVRELLELIDEVTGENEATETEAAAEEKDTYQKLLPQNHGPIGITMLKSESGPLGTP